MCGIIGVAGATAAGAAPPLLDGLAYLTYRGYDSCGIATLDDGRVERRRAAGRVANLQSVLADAPMAGDTGIAHTRWATHGVPNETNAHPHGNAEVAIVHNGIVENFSSLRAELTDAGHAFETDTDSEAIAHLIVFHLRRGLSPEAAADAAFARLKGAFAVAAIIARAPGCIFAVRHGCPLTIGIGEQATWIGSDALALAPFTDRIIHLDEGDRATVTAGGAAVRGVDGQPVERPQVTSSIVPTVFGKGGYRHYMQKEIHEQPIVIGDALRALIDTRAMRAEAPGLPFGFADLDRLVLVGCGTSHYAAGVARHWFEELARLPVDVDIGSEFRDRAWVGGPAGRTAAVLISQSGETADTLAALQGAAAARGPHRGAREHDGEHDGQRGRRGRPDPRRERDQRRLDEGVHGAARHPRLPGARRRAGPGLPRPRARSPARGRAHRRPRQDGGHPRRPGPAAGHRRRPDPRPPASCTWDAGRPRRWPARAR